MLITRGVTLTSMKKKVFLLILFGLICCYPKITSSTALLIGLFFGLIVQNPIKDKTNLYGGYLLKSSIVGLGFGININVLFKAGQENIGTTTFFVFFVLGFGYLLGKILKLDKTISLLISVGTAICGGSAIAAISSVLKADSNQLTVSTGTIFILNAIGLVIFPVFGHYLGLSQEQFGTWAAIAIHDTSSVVGAAARYGDTALNIASITKMLRILWIIPVSLVLVLSFKENRESFKIPMFIVGFIIASLIYSFLPAYANVYNMLYKIAKQALVVSLFLIGSGISMQIIKKVGRKVFFQALALWILTSLVSLYFVIYLYE